MKENLIEIAREYAFKKHSDTNHLYGNGMPYSYHLEMVASYAQQYEHLLFPNVSDIAIASAYVHDVIEDCRETYNDVKTVCGEDVAEVAYALTNEKGKNRAERGNQKYYEGIRANKVAWFIKICDRLANVNYSVSSGSRMADMYFKESSDFKSKLYHSDFDPMFREMDFLFSLKPATA